MSWLKDTSTYPQLNSQDRQQRLNGAMVSALRDHAALGVVVGGNGTAEAFSRRSALTCTGGGVWGRPPCSGSIWKTSERRDSAARSFKLQ